jgi:hypothetical protein
MTFEDLSSFELKRGNHERPEDGLCVLEAVAWFEGEPHSDHPRCVCPVLAHFCRSFNDRLGDRRQALIPYIPRLASTVGTQEVVRGRLEVLATAFERVGGGRDFAERLKARFARAPLPAHAESFGLSVLCDAVIHKHSAADGFAILDRLLAIGTRSPGSSTDVAQRAKALAKMTAG